MKSAIIKTTACLLMILPFAAQAATISLLPANQTVTSGEIVTLSMVGDFSGEATFGGGIDVFYDDGILAFVSFTFDASLADDALLRRQPDMLMGELNGIGFGTLDTLSGVFVIGELSFVALTPGTSLVTMAVNEGGPGPIPGGPNNPGPFVDTLGQELPVLMFGASVQVVPIPAAAWLLLGALGMLGSVRRRGR